MLVYTSRVCLFSLCLPTHIHSHAYKYFVYKVSCAPLSKVTTKTRYCSHVSRSIFFFLFLAKLAHLKKLNCYAVLKRFLMPYARLPLHNRKLITFINALNCYSIITAASKFGMHLYAEQRDAETPCLEREKNTLSIESK